ncbi:BolA/IbaG family iron-sulfur metabolism protein [Fretibacter rubidus]|uniref:BolA/IbaG family iron-sulfur metabolism protein n=1 Tax=Fretibacter rubidus TaxID=570162 RepID=UPI00352A062F
MAMTREDLSAMLAAALPEAEIELIDLAGDNNHWKAVITSVAFVGLNRIKQHQLVYAALQDKMDGPNGELHALALETKVPE